MVNIDEFIKRLEAILDYYNLNASSFADKIGVQRSSLSHLLSGRNKPSLDLVLKITEEFPEVDLYWLLNGTGSFPSEPENTVVLPPKEAETVQKPIEPAPIDKNALKDLFTTPEPVVKQPIEAPKESVINQIAQASNTDVEKIVFFYKNGTFKIFNPF